MHRPALEWLPDLSGSAGPKYLAIARAMAEDIATGRLAPGTQLPTHRELAYQLGVTVGTVSRAYAEATRRGLIDGEVGRGTFVRRRIGRDMGEIPIGANRGGIDFGLNYPPLGASEREAFAAAMHEIADGRDLMNLLAYAPHGGAPRHRRAAADWMVSLGVKTDADRAIVTTGGQNGMLAAFSALVQAGDTILVEKLTYPGIVPLAEMLGLKVQPVELDGEGLSPDALEEACRSFAPRALYFMPTLQNPTNTIMSAKRREQVAEIAARYNLILVEDDIYRFLVEDAPEPLSNLLPDQSIFITSAAKQLAPGLRIGGVSAPRAMVPRLERAMRASTWMAAPAMAEIFALWVDRGIALRLAREKAEEMRKRQQAAAEILQGFEFAQHPTSMHLWLMVPAPWTDRDAVAVLGEQGVSVSSGQVFATAPGAGRNRLRLSLGNPKDLKTVRHGLTLVADTLAGAPHQAASIV
ncbi:MAG: PLP-dependent aminotransferase family protein [Nisaea sp.]|uniref:MocR-like ectoine utilization transcription factor EhuR n=1 Tax=Nisaea sp. TaxID=2024842 RepID=UPI001B07529F|nr:PLP-dependent aminotransferase family protein [Nisaea sp.]MBO6559278.1 PLP-dependent aminotransferase family protein [Nisaea sp.]